MPVMYEVEHFTLCQGWTNCWTTYDEYGNGHPTRFQTKQEAQADLREFLADTMEAFQKGHLDSPEQYDQYRISAVYVQEQKSLL